MLRVRIHHQSDDPSGFSIVWNRVLNGSIARNFLANLRDLGSDPMQQGELLSLRIKDGEGGGCQTDGCFLGLEIKELEENRRMADVYFDADKWQKW